MNINSVEDLAENKPQDVAEKIGISRKVASRWIKAARRALSRG